MARSRRSRKPSPKPTPRKRLLVELLEDRLAPASLEYLAADNTPLTLRLSEPNQLLQIVNTQAPTQVLASQPLAAIPAVRIAGNGLDTQLTVDASVPALADGIDFVGGAGTNTLIGPARDVTWTVTGDGEGHLGDAGFLRFRGVDNLTGAADNQDTFVFS